MLSILNCEELTTVGMRLSQALHPTTPFTCLTKNISTSGSEIKNAVTNQQRLKIRPDGNPKETYNNKAIMRKRGWK